MPSRVIRGEIVKSQSLARVSEAAELLFHKLLLLVDDYGRYDGDPEIIAAHAYPRRRSITADEVWDRLSELESADGPEEGPIRLYLVDDRPYLYLPNWEKHRGKSRRGKQSRWPEPPEYVRGIRGDPRGSADTHGDPPGVAGCRGSEESGCRGEELCSTSPSGKRGDQSPPPGDQSLPPGDGSKKDINPPTPPLGERRKTVPEEEVAPPRKHTVGNIEAQDLARELMEGLLENVDHWTPPKSLGPWEIEFDRMLRLDGSPPGSIPFDDILRTIRWVVRDDFEQKNVQSAAKLRKRFGSLYAKANSGGGTHLDLIQQAVKRSEENDARRQSEETASAGSLVRVVPKDRSYGS